MSRAKSPNAEGCLCWSQHTGIENGSAATYDWVGNVLFVIDSTATERDRLRYEKANNSVALASIFRPAGARPGRDRLSDSRPPLAVPG